MQNVINSQYQAQAYVRTPNPTQVQNGDDVKRIQEAYSNIDVRELTNSYLSYFQNQSDSNSSSNIISQISVFSSSQFSSLNNSQNSLNDILSNVDFNTIGYQGVPIANLSTQEASALISEDGFFGIANTADRISNFIISGAGDDLNTLQAGREGMLKGFEEAQRLWGDMLPEISQQTMDRALFAIDQQIAKLGGNVLNVSA